MDSNIIIQTEGERTSYGLIEGYVNTTSDISILSTNYTAGSKVTVIATGEKYILNQEKQWVLTPQ